MLLVLYRYNILDGRLMLPKQRHVEMENTFAACMVTVNISMRI